MKFIKSILVSLLSVMLTLLSISSVAGPGHDHGDSAPQTLGSSSPRFVAESEDLELVGIVNGKKITLYLDRFQSNTPVKDAVIEIDIASVKYKANQISDGEFEITLKDSLMPGVIAITATVQVGDLTDLLVGELDLHTDEEASKSERSWKSLIQWIVIGLLVLIAIGLFVRSRQKISLA